MQKFPLRSEVGTTLDLVSSASVTDSVFISFVAVSMSQK